MRGVLLKPCGSSCGVRAGCETDRVYDGTLRDVLAMESPVAADEVDRDLTKTRK